MFEKAFDKVKKFLEIDYIDPLVEPVKSTGEIIRDTGRALPVKAKKRSFKRNLLIGIGTAAAVGLALSVLPLGLGVAGIITASLLQIPITVFQDSLFASIKKMLPHVKAIVTREEKLRPKTVLAVAAGAALAVGAVATLPLTLPGVASTLGFAAMRSLAVDAIERVAMPVAKFPLAIAGEKAVDEVENYKHKEDSTPQAALLKEKAEITRDMDNMSAPQRIEEFDELKSKFGQDFGNAAPRQNKVDVAATLNKHAPAAPASASALAMK